MLLVRLLMPGDAPFEKARAEQTSNLYRDQRISLVEISERSRPGKAPFA